MVKSTFFVALCAVTNVQNSASFSTNDPRPITSLKSVSSLRQLSFSFDLDSPLDKIARRGTNIGRNDYHRKTSACGTLASASLAFFSSMGMAAAAADDVEIAELPPVYVPIVFAIGVLGGVGVLTASLGDVMDEEASLGLQSGARAKKERERSRSSYFKK
mmetsp:Transcript_8668/g.18526  ORF Transcript_8668/g.18526 Transcript_8668/m.18526 type:complete len:160 (+) Transcript_8668:62-541(+)|eukprot:CAMPEP_0171332022 /NCGR_PEP_ID=MMETSP0878-20121228/3109_1 /TAXON_ID=67004 /ORGANISM="Thalassiosira weissflogii, Strain CCMP1336" /LENGTH=159 /DNA_ID=CAMNT_0011832701 /DNA_START=28 /DNA_END=507 /DNA_ORIENTATION=-